MYYELLSCEFTAVMYFILYVQRRTSISFAKNSEKRTITTTTKSSHKHYASCRSLSKSHMPADTLMIGREKNHRNEKYNI